MSKRTISKAVRKVTATIPMSFFDGADVDLTADLTYLANAPYALSVVFRYSGESVEWTFGRELLARGIHEPSGVGDVQVWPTLDARGSALVVVELCSPEGLVQVQASSRDVAQFLAATYHLVPAGTEYAHLDIDAELAGLVHSRPPLAERPTEVGD